MHGRSVCDVPIACVLDTNAYNVLDILLRLFEFIMKTNMHLIPPLNFTMHEVQLVKYRVTRRYGYLIKKTNIHYLYQKAMQ